MTAATTTILLIEDDERLARLTARYLETHKIGVEIASDGVAGQHAALSGTYDCIVLDVHLPGCNGLTVCRVVRAKSTVPIVMIGADPDNEIVIRGLEIGADTFVPKPFSARELLARIRACVRRYRGQVGPSMHPIHVGSLVVDPRTAGVVFDGAPVPLTPREFSILRVLAERAGLVVTREQFSDLVIGAEAHERSIDVVISRIRDKLGDDARDPRLLKTVRGVGYLLMG